MALSFEPFKLNNSSQDSTLIFFCKSRPKACSRGGTDLKPSTVCHKRVSWHHTGGIRRTKSQHNERAPVDGRYANEDARFGLGTCSRTQYSSSTSGSSEVAEMVAIGCPFPLFLASAALVLALRRASRDLNVTRLDSRGLLRSTTEVDAVCNTVVARVRTEKSTQGARRMHWSRSIGVSIMRAPFHPNEPEQALVESARGQIPESFVDHIGA